VGVGDGERRKSRDESNHHINYKPCRQLKQCKVLDQKEHRVLERGVTNGDWGEKIVAGNRYTVPDLHMKFPKRGKNENVRRAEGKGR